MNIAEIKELGYIPENTLVNADCLEAMKYIPDKSIDCIITDLPYGTTACSWDTIIPFEKLWEQYHRIIKDDGAIVLFGSEPFSSYLRLSNIKNFRYDWIWEKQKAANFLSAKNQPLKYHEIISVFSKNTHRYYPQKYKVLEFEDILKMNKNELKTVFETKDYDRYGKVDRRKNLNNQIENNILYGITIERTRSRDDGFRNPKSVLKINKEVNTNVHPTQKPLKLLEYLVKTYTLEGDLVLDSCMGGGTTCLACKNLNRKYIGIEKEEKYYNISVERLNNNNNNTNNDKTMVEQCRDEETTDINTGTNTSIEVAQRLF